MSKRTLKRQLNLFQVIMLGTAGTLGSGIFVLTGLAADVAGPATFLAILVGGFLSFSIALNYSELATMYPETGGAMTYVREAWGKGLLSFLIGSMDSISSTFYTALSAVGFAYSLSVFFPSIPIIPVAIAAIILFVVLNILGVTNVGNAQIVMGAGLVFAFAVFIIAGFVSDKGFSAATLFPEGRVFPEIGFVKNAGVLLKTIALIYAVYVGFEVIADDAEEVKNPAKNIPIAILVSLVIIMAVYSLTVIVTLGTLPWQQVAGSATALSDAIKVFMPGVGVTIIAMAGMIGALTSINSSMLSATRETFTLSRDGNWPLILSRLNRVRVPFMAIIMIGVISILITVFGVVDFLSYITSAGYLFVLFFSNLAMITLRKKYPGIHRPFKVPLFPLTPILASLTCVIVIFYSDLDAILFTGGVILVFSLYYFGRTGAELWQESHRRDLSPGRWRILMPVLDIKGSENLMKLGALMAESEKDLNMCALTVVPSTGQVDAGASGEYVDMVRQQRRAILDHFIHYAVDRNVPMYTKTVTGLTLADGIVNEIKNDPNVKLLLMNWLEDHPGKDPINQIAKKVIEEGKTSVGVLKDKGLDKFENLLVPVGGGHNSRLAIHLANDIATREGSHVSYIRVIPEELDEETNEDMISYLQEILLTTLGEVPANASLSILYSTSIADAIITECKSNEYDLVLLGTSTEPLNGSVFGKICDRVVEESPYSVLVVHRYQSAPATWLRHQAKRFQRD
jgi:amino acid transporter/nucleotide-binding universal stress UspA family protein